jgi:hypothetical protein
MLDIGRVYVFDELSFACPGGHESGGHESGSDCVPEFCRSCRSHAHA